MRVRIRKLPKFSDVWVAESKLWYQFSWKYQENFVGEKAAEEASAYARELLDPIIVEIKL